MMCVALLITLSQERDIGLNRNKGPTPGKTYRRNDFVESTRHSRSMPATTRAVMPETIARYLSNGVSPIQ
jgi:hypothetical protein